MNKLDLNLTSTLTSFLQPRDIKNLGITCKNMYNKSRQFMTYSYNQHGRCDAYHKLCHAKWI